MAAWLTLCTRLGEAWQSLCPCTQVALTSYTWHILPRTCSHEALPICPCGRRKGLDGGKGSLDAQALGLVLSPLLQEGFPDSSPTTLINSFLALLARGSTTHLLCVSGQVAQPF